MMTEEKDFDLESIIFAKDPHDKIIIINKQELKNYHRLDNAFVFQLLFKLEDDDRFGDFPMEHTNGHINLFKNLDIYSQDWSLLISFLKNGFTPYHHQMNQQAIENVENLNCLCNKLGGIDSFDHYYADFYQKINARIEEDKDYNPQSPEEDTDDKYNWTLLDSNHQGNQNNFQHFMSTVINGKWSAHKTFAHLSYMYVWYRQDKN